MFLLFVLQDSLPIILRHYENSKCSVCTVQAVLARLSALASLKTRPNEYAITNSIFLNLSKNPHQQKVV